MSTAATRLRELRLLLLGLYTCLIPWHAPAVMASNEECGYMCGRWWKDLLSIEQGNAWFEPWNRFVQAKLDILAAVAEQQEEGAAKAGEPYRVLMVGDSTMSHQFGALCAFLGERDGRRFDPGMSQRGTPGCCMDTLPKEEGGGRGLCFEYDQFRFLDPKRPERRIVSTDAYYFGSGLHLLHMYPHWPQMDPMEPLRVQTWLNYESLLEGVVRAVRAKNPGVKVVFMTNHAIADELYVGEYKDIRAAYREREGNATIRAECQRDGNIQVREASRGDPADTGTYLDWHAVPNIKEYIAYPEGRDRFTVDTYCEEALLDRRGSLQLSRRARPVMFRLGVPIVDAARIVEGEAWASKPEDGRHFEKIVPVEVAEFLKVLGAPPPPAARSGQTGNRSGR